MNTVFFYGLTVVLCVAFNFYIHVRSYHVDDLDILRVMIFGTISNLFMYFLGFLAGIIMARSTTFENLESEKPYMSKPDAVGGNNDPLSVI